MKSLYNRNILLIISGGIAAYKSLELIRRLKDEGARVRCILTNGGAQFITPLSVSALSGEPVFTKFFDSQSEHRFGHIRLSREADLIVVAPASANMLASMAHGLADTLASAVLLAAPDRPVLIAPSMNSRMWAHPATQENIKTLATRGIMQIGPTGGFLACGEDGAGRMSEAVDILAAIKKHFESDRPLSGKKALVTSGPTFEPLDPVRFLGNRSSGKQGHALAAALTAQGAEVTLVTGPTALPDPFCAHVIHIETAREMLDSCLSNGPFNIAICAAAVADWRPKEIAEEKIKKNELTPSVMLTENPDILATFSQSTENRPALVIGFAAETNDIENHAKEKFARKGCDWILANEVGKNKGFASDENKIVLLRKNETGDIITENWPCLSKQDIAQQLVKEIISFFK